MLKNISNFFKNFAYGLGRKKPVTPPRAPVLDPVRVIQLSKSIVELHPTPLKPMMVARAPVEGDQVELMHEAVAAPKPVKMTKKQIKEKHLLDPGWDRPVEREAVKDWILTKPDWLERYRRVHSIRPTNYILKSPEYQLWSAEFSDWCAFLTKTIGRQAKRKFGADLLGLNSDLLGRIIMKEFDRILDHASAEKMRLGLIYQDDMDPYEYEGYCARILRSVGWDAEVTKASGDQGVDVVATKSGRTVVIQVKKYTNPAGNDAVQQIYAGRTYYDAGHAAVVCTAGFTRSAQALAEKAGVHLLHHDELHKLEPMLL